MLSSAEPDMLSVRKKNRSAVFQQLSLKQLIVFIACPEGGKFFTQVRVGLGPIEHGSAPVGDNRFSVRVLLPCSFSASF